MSTEQADKRVSYRTTADRLRNHLSFLAKRHPDLWKHVDFIRSCRGKNFPTWPDWCFMPAAGAVAIVTNTKSPGEEGLTDIATIAALSAWRVTQGIYRFHHEILDSVLDTPLNGDLPTDLFYRLPEWCVYIETPGLNLADRRPHGFFSHLEYDVNTGRSELRLLLDYGNKLEPYALHLDGRSIEGALSAFVNEAVRVSQDLKLSLNPGKQGDIVDYLKGIVSPLVSLVLYVCTVNRDVRSAAGNDRNPSKPKPVKTKQGPRIFAAEKPSIWEVGYRIGAALTRAREIATSEGTGSHSSPLPHVRRAHWHSFWTGSQVDLKSREMVVKWLLPIPVGVKDWDEIVPSFREVK